MSEIPACPSCGAVLPKMPKARRKCPDCKEWIYISKPFKSNTKVLMSKTQYDNIQEQWVKEYENEKYEGLDADRWVSKVSHELTQAFENGDMDTARNLSLELSIKAKDKEQRKIFKKQFLKIELLRFQATPHPDICGVIIYKCNKDENHSIPDETVMPIKQALKEMPIPCDADYCNCFYNLAFNNNEEMKSKAKSKQETLQAKKSSPEPPKTEKKSWWKRLLG